MDHLPDVGLFELFDLVGSSNPHHLRDIWNDDALLKLLGNEVGLLVVIVNVLLGLPLELEVLNELFLLFTVVGSLSVLVQVLAEDSVESELGPIIDEPHLLLARNDADQANQCNQCFHTALV